MKRIVLVLFVFMAAAVLFGVNSGYAQEIMGATGALQTKTIDVDKDGDADIIYYSDGKNVVKAEADTNNDGKPDVTVYTENGKFKSAEADTNYDGTPDKKFTDVTQFNTWMNTTNPEYDEYLNQPDWQASLFKF